MKNYFILTFLLFNYDPVLAIGSGGDWPSEKTANINKTKSKQYKQVFTINAQTIDLSREWPSPKVNLAPFNLSKKHRKPSLRNEIESMFPVSWISKVNEKYHQCNVVIGSHELTLPDGKKDNE